MSTHAISRLSCSWWIVLMWLVLPDVQAGPVVLAGVNLPSLYYTVNADGSGTWDGHHPSAKDLTAWPSLGFNFIRYSFAWQYLQPDLNSDFDSSYKEILYAGVKTLTDLGVTVNIDCHTYGRYDERIIGQDSGAPTKEQFGNMWGEIAKQFQNNSKVMFGLMNEPHDLDFTQFGQALQEAITSIRNNGATTQIILLPAQKFDDTGVWVSESESVLTSLNDPSNNLVFDLHAYFDADGSGDGPECLPFDYKHFGGTGPSGLSRQDTVNQTTVAIRKLGMKAIMSEFGGNATQQCNQTVNDFLTYLNQNSDVWMGWTAWGPELDPPDGSDGPPSVLYLGLNDTREYELVHNALLNYLPVSTTSTSTVRPTVMPSSNSQTSGSSVAGSAQNSTLSVFNSVSASTTASRSTTLASETSASSSTGSSRHSGTARQLQLGGHTLDLYIGSILVLLVTALFS